MPHQLESLITRDDIADIAETEQLVLGDDARISILEAMRSIDIQACPGSGKTTLIAAKLILLAKKWRHQHQGVCVLSHTNVAKAEIIERLKCSKTQEAQRLLNYPHFIGTIQEFVNRFLALPITRQSGRSVRFIEGIDGAKEVLNSGVNLGSLYTSLYRKFGEQGSAWPKNDEVYNKIIQQLGSIFWLNTDFDLAFYGAFGSISTYNNDMTKVLYPKLKELKEALEQKGAYQYRDMFVFAEQLLTQNCSLKSAIQSRFPYVLMDEMQDTQKYQDDLLCKIFPLDGEVIVQRFGDPDQAIFHGVGSEEQNQSFNLKSRDDMDYVIHKSHRFDGTLSDMIKCFSFNEIPLGTELSAEALSHRAQAHSTGRDFEHTVIVFTDDTRDGVVEFFAKIVSNQFSIEHKVSPKFTVKVVGAVGKEIDPDAEQLRIGHYWNDFDKTKSKTNYKDTCFVDAVRHCQRNSSVDFSDNYKLLISCIIKLMRMAGKVDCNGLYFSASTLQESLTRNMNWCRFRKGIYYLLNDSKATERDIWNKVCDILIKLLELDNIPVEVIEYMAFIEEVTLTDSETTTMIQETASLVSLKDNRIRHADGFNIELSTIHGIKGETHDATLIVETKNHTFDIQAMLPYLSGELPSVENQNAMLPDKPHWQRGFKPNKVFMRQLYVAMSRPKHLLCLALHSDHISDDHKKLLSENGWSVPESVT